MKKYPSINGLRAISIVMVLAYHFSMQNQLYFFFLNKPILSSFFFFFSDGALGVNIFFVISGFLITSLLIKEQLANGKISLRNFYIRRSLRIFPAYFFLLLIYFILQLFGILKISTISWITALTYTKYFDINSEWLTSHSWSLSVEEHFYLVWPFIFIFFQRTRKIIALFLVLIVPFFRLYFHFYPSSYLIPELNFFVRIDAIAIGCLLSLYQHEIINLIQSNWNRVFYFCLFFLFFLGPLQKLAFKFNLQFLFIPFGERSGLIGNVLIGLIVVYSVFGPQGRWFKLLNTKIFNYIGMLSYSIYLWQQIFTSPLRLWINFFPQNILLIFACAICSYYIIEKPFLKFKTKFEIK